MSLESDTVVQVLLRQRSRIIAASVAILRDIHAADDVFQQVVLAALGARQGIRDADHLYAWAIRTCRHRALDIARRRHLTSLPDDVLDLLESTAEPEDFGVSDQVDALHRCMDKLPGTSKELISMRYQEGLPAAAIADRTKRSVDAVYQSLSRLHRALRNCVERNLDPADVKEGAKP